MSSPDAALLARLQAALRHVAPLVASGSLQGAGASTLALLAAGAVLPLITSGFTPGTLVAMFGPAGGNALASWLQMWSERATGIAANDEQRLATVATDLQEQLDRNADLSAAVYALLRKVGAIAIALNTLGSHSQHQARLLQLLLEEAQGNTVHTERLLSLVRDGQQHDDARTQALLEQLRADVQAISTREATSTAIRIRDSAGATVYNNGGVIAGRDVISVSLHQVAALTPERLADALALLDTMPTAGAAPIPAPQPLTVPHRIELVSNPYFVGRDDDLRRVARILKDGQTCAVTTGIGGIGKTQLAVEFARRYGRFFAGGVFWLSFAEAGSIPNEVTACGGQGALGLFLDAAQLKQDEQVALVRAAWEQPLPRLLIFDNCEDPKLLREWKPERGGCRVLVTSRATNWPGTLSVQRVALNVLPRTESVQLLRRYRPDLAPGDATLDALCAEVGDLPLALHLIGSFLELYRDDVLLSDPAQVLADLRSGPTLQRAAELARDVSDSPTKHDLDVARSFALSYRQLDAANPVDATALALLTRAALLAPGESIPRELLQATLKLADNDAAGLRQTARAFVRLSGLGLLEGVEGGALRLHRLLVAFVQSEGSDEAAREAVESALIEAAFAANQSGLPVAMQPLLPHLRHWIFLTQSRCDQNAAALCTNLGQYLSARGDYSGAYPLYEQALTIYAQCLGPLHATTAKSVNNLAELLYTMGDYDGARLYLEQALAIRETALGPMHPDTAESLNNLGVLFQGQGNYETARSFYERALAIREAALGPMHPDIAESLNNLAALLQAQGQYQGAHQLLERALGIYEQALGANHPYTAWSINNLALLLQAQDNYGAAHRLHERALTIREQTLGPSHPQTAASLNNFATLLEMQGDYTAARQMYERALAIREQALGLTHIDTAQSLNNLATLFASQGNLERALPLLRRTLDIYMQALGQDHVDTQRTRQRLVAMEQAAQA